MISSRFLTGALASLSLIACAHAQTGTALVRHAPILNGTIEGSIQQMKGESVTVGHADVITGDLLVPGKPTVQVNGTPTFGGTIVGGGAANAIECIGIPGRSGCLEV